MTKHTKIDCYARLREFITRRRQKRVLKLLRQFEWDDSFDYKAERTRR